MVLADGITNGLPVVVLSVQLPPTSAFDDISIEYGMKTKRNAIKYDGVFILEQESPISLHEGIIYINIVLRVEARADDFDDEQFGLPF